VEDCYYYSRYQVEHKEREKKLADTRRRLSERREAFLHVDGFLTRNMGSSSKPVDIYSSTSGTKNNIFTLPKYMSLVIKF